MHTEQPERNRPEAYGEKKQPSLTANAALVPAGKPTVVLLATSNIVFPSKRSEGRLTLLFVVNSLGYDMNQLMIMQDLFTI